MEKKYRLISGLLRLLNIGACVALAGATAQAATVAAEPAKPAGNHSVHVVNMVNQPVPGATVKLQPVPAAPRRDLLQETTVTVTDAAGNFEAPQDSPKGAVLVIEKPGLGITAVQADKVPAKIVMFPAAPLTGSVVDDRGTSIAGAEIGPIAPPAKCEHTSIDSPEPPVQPLVFTTTDSNGAFRVTSLPSHNYAMMVRAPGCQPALVTGHTGQPLQLLVYHGGTTVTGKLVGTKDQQPQAGYYIEAASDMLRLYEITDQEGNFAFGNLPNREWLFKPYLGPGKHEPVQAVAVGESTSPTSITLQLNQGAAIAGQVIDDDTSLPMSGVAIGVSAGGIKAQMPTDAQGNFRFEELDALEHYSLRFDTMRYVRVLPTGELRDYFDLPPGTERENVELRLRKRVLVSGRVVDVAGTGVADAQVRFHALDAPLMKVGKAGEERRERQEFITDTNANGEFKYGLYPAGRYEISATRNEQAAEPKRVDAFTTAPPAALELRLRQTVELGGTVVDPDDKAVTGALVMALPIGSAPTDTPTAYERSKYPSSRTNTAGEFTITGLAANQQVLLSATHRDFIRPATATYAAGSAEATTGSVKLRFASGGEVEAFVMDPDGAPVSAAEVVVHFAEGLEGQQASRETDRTGHVRIRGIPASRIERLVVQHRAYAEYDSAKPLTLPQNGLKIQLRRKTTLTVKLVGNAGSPEATREVQAVLLGSPEKADVPAGAQQAPAPETYTEQTRTAFAENKASFADLSPGWYKAALSGGTGYVESDAIYIAGDSPTAEVSIQAPPSITIRGHVSDRVSGKPIPGATVTILPTAQVNQASELSARTAYSDAAGNFEMPNASLGAVNVKVVAFGYPEFEDKMQAAANAPLNIQLSNAAGALAGTVTMSGKPLENALMVLSKAGTTEKPLASSVTDAAGHYTLSGFPAGKYQVSVEAEAGESTTRRTVEVTVTDENSRQDIDMPALVHISGSVRLGGKAPLHADGSPSSILFAPKAGGSDGRTVQLGKDGSYATDIEPGSYSVGIEDRPGQDVEISNQQSQTLNLEF
jgi:uncharacterized GH25 family protein